jgi:hypothetical protein
MQQERDEKEISTEPVDEDEPEHPVPGVEHYPEPDAENIMPAEDRPGTF